MRDFKKTKNLNVNAIVIALLTVLMAAAVVFGGTTLWSASAAAGGGIGGGGMTTTTTIRDSSKDVSLHNLTSGETEIISVAYKTVMTESSFGTTFSSTITLPSTLSSEKLYYDFSCSNSSLTSRNNTVPVTFTGAIDLTDSVMSALSFSCYSHAPVPLPDEPVKEGYHFVGWYYDEAYTRAYDGEPITADTTLYAKMEINTYTVTFNSNGGTSVDAQTVEWNKAASLVTPTQEGYDFLGWFMTDGTKYTTQPVTSDMTLTARWEIKHLTVTFDSAGGSVVDPVTVDYGNTLSAPTPIRDGYSFIRWNYENGYPYTDQAITTNVKLTAQWSINTFTVTFDSAGGPAVESQTIEWNSTASAPSLDRTGYTFLGWYNGETKYEGQAITADTTLTAHWEILRFTVTFYMDGSVYETMEVDYGTTFQEAMTANAKLCFMNLLNSEGIKVAKSGVITADVSAPVGEMTREEKVATFIGNNWWLLVVGGVLIVAGILSTVIASLIAHKRK